MWYARLIKILLALSLTAPAFGQALSYIPPSYGLFYSSDGTGSSGTWNPLTGSGGSNPLTYVPPTMGMYYSNDGTGNINTWVPCTATCGGGGGGSGTVTSFSAGTLSPLFTTSVATSTTTPALTFTLSSATANTLFGNPTGSSAAPSFTAVPSCSGATNALTWTSGTGFGCNTIGSAPAFSAITSGTNTTAAMVVGTGGSLTVSGTGTINATSINAATVPASATVLGSNASNQLAAATTTGTGTTVVLSGTPTLVTPVLGAATGTSISITGQYNTSTTTGSYCINGDTGLYRNVAGKWTLSTSCASGNASGNLQGNNLIATGVVDGPAPTTVTTGTTATLGGTFASGFTINQEATAATGVAYTLPTAAAGKQYCIENGWNGTAATTGVLTLNTSASGQFIIFTDGTLSATGGNVTSGGAAADMACVHGIDATHWQLNVIRGTWTKH